MADTAITKTAAHRFPLPPCARNGLKRNSGSISRKTRVPSSAPHVFLALVIIAVFAHFIAPHSPI